MRFLTILRMRLRSLVSRTRVEAELDEELRYHLERHVEELLASGVPPEEAQRSARRSLAGIEQRKEECSDARGVNVIDNTRRDVQFAIRQLARNPGFTATAIVMLTLGTGASLAVFAFVDAALIRPLPYAEPTKLVEVTERTPQIPRAALSYLDYLDWKRLNTVFTSLDVYAQRGYMLRNATGTEVVPGVRVSDGFFRTLGVVPVLGRDFRPGEDLPTSAATVIVSHAAWQARFGGRPDTIGQSVTLDGTSYLVIGVLPANFEFAPAGTPDFWTTLRGSNSCERRRSCHNLSGVARLKDGASIDAARAEITTIARQLETQYPDSNRDQSARVAPLSDLVVGDIRPVLLVLLAGAVLLLVIAWVNATSLLLVRAETRRRELAVRSALGASRARLVSQFVTEAVVLVALGSAAGLVAGRWAITLGVRLVPPDMLARMPFLHAAGLTAPVIAGAALVAFVATIVFAVTPAVRLWTSDPRLGMADGCRSSGTVWHRLGFKLVVLELATAVVLLVGAGLLTKSLYRLVRVNLGFEPGRLALVRVALPRTSYNTDERIVTAARELLTRTASLPGVESAALTSTPPVTFNGNTDWIRFVGRPYNGEHNEVNQRDVSPDYFRTLHATLLRGRHFTEADSSSHPKVVIINEALATRYFPGEDPIGKRFGDTSLTPASIKEIVGIVENIREGPLDSTIWPAAYYPFAQDPDSSFVLLARGSLDATSLLPAILDTIREADRDIGTNGVTTMAARIADSPVAYLRRSSAWLIGAFALVAGLLGIIGLYGVIAYAVSQRRREIGVRIALGAQPSSVYHLVLTQAGRLVVIGIGAGLACSVAGAILMRQLLFQTPPWDAATLSGVAVALGAAALGASYLPARRAASVDPVEALRAQ